MPTLPTIQHRDKSQLDPAFVRALVEHGNRARVETQPDDPAVDPQEMIGQLAHLPPILDLDLWSVPEGDGMCAYGQVQIMNLDTNRHLAEVRISVERHARRAGLGRELLRRIAAHCEAQGRTLMIAQSVDRVPAGAAFLERYGFTRGLETHVNQLRLSDVPEGLLDDWTTPRSAEYMLELWDDTIPEADLHAYAELLNVMNSAPKDDLNVEDFHVTPELLRQEEAMRQAANRRALIAVVRHRSGELVGLNDLSWRAAQPGIVSQGATGVQPAHRGHRLGQWLKAANVRRLLEVNTGAQVIRTGNANSNAPMLRINEEMGFRPYLATTVWQGEVSEVRRRLG